MISIIEKINESLREEIANESKRNYIGASAIGHPCSRKIWYEFKGYDGAPISEKLKITFDAGKCFENIIISYLDSIMYKGNVINTFPVFCNSIRDFKGTIDCIITIDDKEYILEIKTANNASFNKFKKNGLRVWNEQYYAQCQSYMGMSSIHQSVLLAINKDTSEMHEEWVEYDPIYYGMLKQKAKDIIDAKEAPSRINESPLFYICSMCQFKKVCH